jgi:hypothetical protein
MIYSGVVLIFFEVYIAAKGVAAVHGSSGFLDLEEIGIGSWWEQLVIAVR